MDPEPEFYKTLLDNLSDGVYFVDKDRLITYWNKGAERITGFKADKVAGFFCGDNILNHVDANGVILCGEHCPLKACMEDGIPREADVFLHHANGHRLPVTVRANPIKDADGNIIGAVETFSNSLEIMAVRNELNELRHSYLTDTLTGIGNREFLEGRLRALIAEYQNREKTIAGILFIDIDQFKNINDTFGHDVGDTVLQMVSDTLHRNMRKSDVIGRWGGEEFMAILYDIASMNALVMVAEKMRMLVEHSSLDFEGTQISTTISIGGTLMQPDDTVDSLFHRVDQLMYHSKQFGRNRVTLG